ncbi:MAG: putative Ig domain-containing protein [Pseudomonadales bacterium]|nr:putative Ig domain-containing protein [Pseudomonadales bacterium]
MLNSKMECAALLSLLVVVLVSGCAGSDGGDGDGDGTQSNEVPFTSGLSVASVRAGDVFEFQLDANDPDGDSLSFDGEELPDWLTLDEATGLLSGTPENTDIGRYDAIILSVSDSHSRVFFPSFRIDVLPALLSRANFVSGGVVTPTGDGFENQGEITFDYDDGSSQTFAESDLVLEFNEDDELTSINGDVQLSGQLVPGLEIASETNAGIGLYFGSELNENDAINILLQDERQYYAFFIDTGIDINLSNPDGSNPESLSISTPASGTIVIIIDPYDPMNYRYAQTPFVGEFEAARSKNGLLPFVPILDHPQLDSFDGHRFDTGSFSLGIKVFDLLSFTGQQVTREPSFSDIDFEDPFASEVEFKTGINGQAEFEFSVFGFGLFSFSLAEASATVDVGFDRQSFAMQTVIAPDVTWAPDWFPFLPTTEVIGDFFVNGSGGLEASLAGSYISTIPSANVNGKIVVSQEQVTMSGEIIDRISMPVSITFSENRTEAVVGIDVSFESEINEGVSAGFDRAEQAVDDAVQQIEDAIADFEFEASLRGLRSAIPAIADTAIAKLNAIPTTLRSSVDTAVVNAIKDKTVCKTIVFTVCKDAKDYVNESTLGDEAGTSAQTEATTRIAPYIASFEDLKFRALQADDESLRIGLELALREVYDRRRVDESITVSVGLGTHKVSGVNFNFGTISHTVNVSENILTTEQANNILTAANNAHKIQESSDTVVSAESYLGEIPTKEIIAEVRTQVDEGIKQIPDVESVGYVVDHGVYTATVHLSDGSEHSVEFNVLSVDEAIIGITDLLATYVIEN